MMKKCFLFFLICIGIGQYAMATSYYINSAIGKDNNTGTNRNAAWKTILPLKNMLLKPGDSILFASGQKYTGMLALEHIRGTQQKPVVVTAYTYLNDTSRPVLDAGKDLYTILIKNASHIKVSRLEITAVIPVADQRTAKGEMRCGILVEVTDDNIYEGITLKDLVVHDIYYHLPGFKRSAAETKSANGTQSYGWGIRFINQADKGKMQKIRVTATVIYNVSHTGLKFTTPAHGIKGVEIDHNRVYQTGGPGMQFSGVSEAHIHHNQIQYSGSVQDSRNWGRGSGLWTWSCSDILIEYNRFENANGPGDSAGVHIDFNCSDVIIQYNFSANNAGGFCEILGNNYNCAYRYNISVNDGYRVKGENGAFQEGKIFWLSGYQGDKQKPSGPFNSYFYNNTIYVASGIVPKIAVSATAKGMLIMNNIFCFEDSAVQVAGDQFKADAGLNQLSNALFKNNLFLHKNNWPAALVLQDAAPVIADPIFSKKGGLSLSDYTPGNKKITRNMGLNIPMLPGDTTGLKGGLKMTTDILGNKIKDKPDMGAIEWK